MLHLGRAKLVFNVQKAPVSLCSLYSSFSTLPQFVPRCALATVANSHQDIMSNSYQDLFEYTSGNWVYNNALRHKERRLVFNVDALCRLAAESVNQSPANVVNVSKLAEGGFNRTLLITLRDGFKMVARIPYPVTAPKFYAVASEVATLDSCVLCDQEVISVIRQLTQLESAMMSLSFPAGGSLYFTKDLEKTAKGLGIPLEDDRFCIGPDTRLPLWYGKRSRLDVNRGPYPSAEAALVAGARKELAYLKQFDQPLMPFRRERRAGYQYQEQSPSAHIKNLNLYLRLAASLVPRDPTLSRFCIRHPDLQQSNIIRLQNYDDPVSQSMTVPSLPEDFDQLDEVNRIRAEVVYRDRLVHYHYVKSMEERNKLHYAAFTDRLFLHAGSPWEGETFELKLALIQATENWTALSGGGMPCPVEFDAEEVCETKNLNEVQATADNVFAMLQNIVGLGEDGWVSTEDYEDAVAFFRRAKEEGLAGANAHWPWDDMDEEEYV
ncbi:protein kinase subdomain-containing protein PKL/CAK/Fmp29 [Rhodocollybia butyracea]|uniref:Protein kinase subdomain-containing protein PKL/CAK/Fmp29 n=1 Tax=Rhodocollybia butyracea TaxID=206335 RepID=A0A9P5Q014_9AGAR|nr:protein kinase subdomain-containing protein PKL/CAK/Fmp29 [Rhodocollybia butyracea]